MNLIHKVKIKNEWGGGVHAKQCIIPAGLKLVQHGHEYDHLSILAKGQAEVIVDGVSTIYGEGSIITIKAGKLHEVISLTDVTWYCLHQLDEADYFPDDEAETDKRLIS